MMYWKKGEEELKNFPENIDIPNSEKDFITLFSSSNSTFRLYATHRVPPGYAFSSSGINELDTYGVFRIFNTLADYIFNHNVIKVMYFINNIYHNKYQKFKADHKAVN